MSGGETVARARNRWRELLPRLGVAPGFLKNTHGPCPLCGGKDRFRFDDKDGHGTFYCNQCGPGNGIVLAQRANGLTFKEAADAIDQMLGDAPPCSGGPHRQNTGDDPGRRLGAIKRTLKEADHPGIVREELARRGLSVVPRVLRGHPSLPYYDPDGRLVGTYPAIVAPVAGADQTLQCAHRIYTDRRLDPRKKLMRPVDTVKGGAVRLFNHGDVIGVAEGIETAIACYEMFRVPTWAALSADNMEAWRPPAGVRTVYVFGDCDESLVGQKAAYTLGTRLRREGYEVHVEIPPPDIGTDWLDALGAPEVAA